MTAASRERSVRLLDFTSVLYLGLRHPAHSLRSWAQLTTGVPAALGEPRGAGTLARHLARLQGCEQAIIGPSTFHLFWDLFTMFATQSVTIFMDAATYPIARWGVERAAARGVPVRSFPHQDVERLARLVHGEKSRPVIVSDGLCSGCGCTAPLAAYHEIVRRRGGWLVLDDTQALGLLGVAPDPVTPYGWGGGGSLCHHALAAPEIILVSSLAKSFGVPLAVLSSSGANVQRFQQASKTRIHCSPPALPVLIAGARALAVNRTQGDARRRRLAQNVLHFRRLLAGEGAATGQSATKGLPATKGLSVDGGLFPIQTLRLPKGVDAPRLHQRLLREGLRTVLRGGCDGRPAISLVITARHRPRAIAQAAQICHAACSKVKGESR